MKRKKLRTPAKLTTLDAFLKQEGKLEEFEAVAIKEVLAWQIGGAVMERTDMRVVVTAAPLFPLRLVPRAGLRGFIVLAVLLAPLSSIRAESFDLAICRTAKEHERGIEACSRIIAEAGTPRVLAEALVQRGRFYGRTRNRDLALADFTAAIALEPDNPFAYKVRGGAYFGAQDFERALADYSEAIRLDAQDAEAYRVRGDVRVRQRQYDEARADYAAAIRLKPPGMDSVGQCRISASLYGAFFHCTHVVLDAAQSADIRAEAQRRLDLMMRPRPPGR